MKNLTGKERLFERAISAKHMSLVCLLEGTARGYNNSYYMYDKYRHTIEAIQMVGLWKEYTVFYDNHKDYDKIDKMYEQAEKEGSFKKRKEYELLDRDIREFFDKVKDKMYNKTYKEAHMHLNDLLGKEVAK